MLKNLKKYIPKRKYRERSQLERRLKTGFLEKKQDYKLRADDFHVKQEKYKKLKEEARLKNPEEFYFKMTNSKVVDGEHIKIKDEKSFEARLGSQNKLLNLVNFKKSMQEKEKDKLMMDLQLMDHGGNSESTHQIFFDSVDECANFKAEKYFDTDKSLLKNKTNRIKTSQLEKIKLEDNEEEIKTKQAIKKIQYKTLSEKIKNVESLNKISSALDYQKHLQVYKF
jgi:U3 small nucleolar RNA-associated protein 11